MAAPDLELRDLTDADIADVFLLNRRAFGFPATERPLPEHLSGPVHGAFVGGRLVGAAFDLEDQQWWGGRLLAAADLAGVAVAPELRGQGVARALIARLLAHARERGAAVSALFPTVATVYRSLGWVSAGSLDTIALPTATLPHGPLPAGVSVREGSGADLPAMDEVYRRIAVAGNGMLSHTVKRFELPPGELPRGVDGVTLALTGDEVTGYCWWSRGANYGRNSVLSVSYLIAADTASARALVSVLHSWHTVTPVLHLELLGGDAIADVLPLELGAPEDVHRWMHRPVDLVAAVQGRGWPIGARGRAVFAIEDSLAPWNSGTWALDIGDGGGQLKRTTDDTSVTLTVAGFASLYCGLTNAESLRLAGHVSGPHDDAAALDVLATSAPPRLIDDF